MSISGAQQQLGSINLPYPGALVGHSHSYTGPFSDPSTARQTPMGMIASRMRWPEVMHPPFDYIDAYRVDDDKYYVFVVQNKQAVVLEDGSLFPSDALITQLRLLAEKK